MGKGIVIADSGPIFSLAAIDKLDLLNKIFDDINIPRAVWNEISLSHNKPFHDLITYFFKDKIVDIKGFNDLTFIMDYFIQQEYKSSSLTSTLQKGETPTSLLQRACKFRFSTVLLNNQLSNTTPYSNKINT
jgi:predicted nucleic acid-binding protein